jgi:hypothetical protein
MTALSSLVQPLRRECSPPGADLFPDATDNDFIGYLSDGFWEARLDGFLSTYTLDLNSNTISPDLPDYYQYLVVLWAGVRICRTRLSNTQTAIRQQAGPVSQEIQYSAQMLRDVLDEIRAKKQRLIDLSYHITDVKLVDGNFQRDYNDLTFNRADF